MTTNWQDLAAKKRTALYDQIPKEWRLPASTLAQIHGDSPPTDPLTPASSYPSISVLHIPKECGVLTSREIELTENFDATDLIQMMGAGDVSSYDVTLAFCKRAAIAQQCVNCLTEFFPGEALERARACDAYLTEEGRPMGPLHGIPISLKDSFNVKGIQSTIGYVSFLPHVPASSNAALVDILLKAGAVIYCKTNLPQTMMTADSHNNIFGRTLNPHNLSLTAGGSTGGEGALIAMRGSVLGLATDIAGSSRIPALCCGIKSFKPSSRRMPFKAKTPPGRLGSPGQILPIIGPQGRSIRDFSLLFKTVIDSEPWRTDEGVLDLPWRTVEPVMRPLRFGLLRGCEKRPLHPSVKRVLHTAAMALKKEGHEVIEVTNKVPDIWAIAVLAYKYFTLDPQKTSVQYINASGEPWIPSIATAFPEELKGWTADLNGLWDTNMERAKVLSKWHDVFVEERLDAVICPGYQTTAVPHDTYGIPAYTVLQNLIDHPAGMLPLLKADTKLDEQYLDEDAKYMPPYVPEAVDGVPGAIQIMGRPMRDEELMEVMNVVESVLEKAA